MLLNVSMEVNTYFWLTRDRWWLPGGWRPGTAGRQVQSRWPGWPGFGWSGGWIGDRTPATPSPGGRGSRPGCGSGGRGAPGLWRPPGWSRPNRPPGTPSQRSPARPAGPPWPLPAAARTEPATQRIHSWNVATYCFVTHLKLVFKDTKLCTCRCMP